MEPSIIQGKPWGLLARRPFSDLLYAAWTPKGVPPLFVKYFLFVFKTDWQTKEPHTHTHTNNFEQNLSELTSLLHFYSKRPARKTGDTQQPLLSNSTLRPSLCPSDRREEGGTTDTNKHFEMENVIKGNVSVATLATDPNKITTTKSYCSAVFSKCCFCCRILKMKKKIVKKVLKLFSSQFLVNECGRRAS